MADLTSNREMLVNLLVLIFSVTGMVGLVISLFWPRLQFLAIKVFASLVVIGISFAACNAFIYAISLFIVATLVTELEFLERLAAIAWGRKEYWPYAASRGSRSDVRKKIEQDVLEESPGIKGGRVPASDIDNAVTFERLALELIKSHSHELGIRHLRSEIRVTGKGRSDLIDAIAECDGELIIIEIKASVTLRILQRGADQLRRYSAAYGTYLAQRGEDLPIIRPLIVAPNAEGVRKTVRRIPVMLIDTSTHSIVNLDVIKKYLQSEESEDDES